MNDRSPSRVSRTFTSAAALAIAAGSAWAQSSPLRPPTPDDLDSPNAVLTILITAALAGVLLLAAFFPSKRGHQD